MINYAAFSALRLRHIFPAEHLHAYDSYWRILTPEDRSFDIEYMGGQWDDEQILGVTLWFPAIDGSKVGIVTLATGPYTDGMPAPGTGFTGSFVESGWVANANRVLEALALPVRMGAGEAAVSALAAGQVCRCPFSDGRRCFLSFACRAPDVYHVQAVVHDGEGLLRLEIRRPDLVRGNDHEGGYDACFGELFDEGEGR